MTMKSVTYESYNLDEALKVAPSFEFGNGIFIAAFRRWNKKDQEEARLIESLSNQAQIPKQIEDARKKKKVNINLYSQV